MYGWLWRVFPGGLVGKLLCTLLMGVAALALLFFVVFPRVEPLMPYQDVTVDPGPSSAATASPGP